MVVKLCVGCAYCAGFCFCCICSFQTQHSFLNLKEYVFPVKYITKSEVFLAGNSHLYRKAGLC